MANNDRKKKLRERAAKETKNRQAIAAARNKEYAELVRTQNPIPKRSTPKSNKTITQFASNSKLLSVESDKFEFVTIYGQRCPTRAKEGLVFPCGAESHIVVSDMGAGNVGFNTTLVGSDLSNFMANGHIDYVSPVKAIVQDMLDTPADERSAGAKGKAITQKCVWYSESGSDIEVASWVPRVRFWGDETATILTEDNELAIALMHESFALVQPKGNTGFADSIDICICGTDLYVLRNIINDERAMAEVYAEMYSEATKAVHNALGTRFSGTLGKLGGDTIWHDAPDNQTRWVPFDDEWPCDEHGSRLVLNDPNVKAVAIPVGLSSYFYQTEQDARKMQLGELRLRDLDARSVEIAQRRGNDGQVLIKYHIEGDEVLVRGKQ